jgi:hypothetical protein
VSIPHRSVVIKLLFYVLNEYGGHKHLIFFYLNDPIGWKVIEQSIQAYAVRIEKRGRLEECFQM